MQHVYNDGGREAAGFKGKTGDCGIRAVAIATGLPYREVYDAINALAKSERITKRKKKISNSRAVAYAKTLGQYLESYGWVWVATMKFGQGCTVHMRAEELPSGRIVTRLSKHYAAVIDGTVQDTYNSSRDGNRCVYGYWIKAS